MTTDHHTASAASPVISIAPDHRPPATADDLRRMADLMDMLGHRVLVTYPDGHTFSGVLSDVYWTDGLAANIEGDSRGDFSYGPLYGANVARISDGPHDEWNGNIYEVEVSAVMEANTPEDAQRLFGRLLAGLPNDDLRPIPLNGPGSWACDKRITQIEQAYVEEFDSHTWLPVDPSGIDCAEAYEGIEA